VEFSQKPELRPWGIEAIFEDLYGNKYALVQESAQVLTDEAESSVLGLRKLRVKSAVVRAQPKPA
jgi:hypothetical protein